MVTRVAQFEGTAVLSDGFAASVMRRSNCGYINKPQGLNCPWGFFYHEINNSASTGCTIVSLYKVQR